MDDENGTVIKTCKTHSVAVVIFITMLCFLWKFCCLTKMLFEGDFKKYIVVLKVTLRGSTLSRLI